MSCEQTSGNGEKRTYRRFIREAQVGVLSSVRFSLLGVLLFTTACARVAPYERETLARRDMALGRNEDLAAGEDHAHAYREGSSGGGEAKGGGCGCN
jgi:hypothetical protein